MPSLIAILGLNASSFSAGLSRARRDASETGGEIAHSLGEAVNEKIAEFANIGFIEETIRRTMEYAEQVSLVAQRLNISTDAAQKWDYALQLNGSNLATAATFFERLAEARDEAMQGMTEEIQYFKTLGVTMDDLKGKRLEDLAAQIAKVFETGDPQKLIGALREIGGRGAGEMVAAFRSGFAELLEEADHAGAVISESSIDKMREASDSMKTIWIQFRAGIAPIVSGLADGVIGLWRGLNSATRFAVGFITGGAQGAEDLVNEYQKSIDDADKAAEDRAKKQKERFSGGAASGQDRSAAAKVQKDASERQRLEEQLYALRQKNSLDQLSKEQQITELFRRRKEIADYISKNWKSISEAGKLRAQIDLEQINSEINARSGKDKAAAQKRAEHPDVNDLQKIGAYAGEADAHLQIQRTNQRTLSEINQGIKTLVTRTQTGGGVQF